ncbi:hypothetical protein Sste5344_001548 [Sporothrix stenoceras]
MANGIDRLERLFSKKKYAAASREQQQAADYAPPPTSYSSRFALRKGSAAAASPSSPTRYSPLNDMHFPQPSFIRPKAARMIPRDDHAYAPTSPSRPGTANRSICVPEGPPTLPQITATVLVSPPTSPTKVVAPPRSAGGPTTRSPHGPPVAYQARSMSVTSPHRRTFDSRRSSGSINYNYCSTSATLSSSGSSTMSSSTHTSNGSNNHPNRRSSYIETPCELSDAAARAAPNNGRILASVNVHRLPKRSSSLLQRRDVFVSPLANLDTYQISNTGRRGSVAITISSGEISPATVQATPIIPSSSPASPKENQQEQQQPELKIQGDELHELRELQGLPDLQQTPPLKDLQQPIFFTTQHQTVQTEDEQTTEEKVEEVPASTSPKQSEPPIFTETPLLCRDSVFAPIVLPQSRPTSPSASAVSARRRSRLARRPMSLRYQRHLPIEPKPSSPSSVLMEPNLGDFLSLSDDDIAEDVAAAAAAAAATAATAEATSTAPVVEVVEEEKKGEVLETSTPRASMVPLPAETPAATEDVPPTTPPKTPQQAKSALSLQKPLPPAPTEAIAPATSSSRVSPNALARRVALAATAPSLPPAFQAPPPAFLSLLPGMPLLPSPMSVTPSASAAGRPRTPAGEARMAAAFEIARIASQYKFDLAYIATIWPKNMAFPISSAAASASASTSTTARPQSIGWPSSPTSPSCAANKVSRNNSQISSRPPLSGRGANRASHASHGSQNSFVSQSSSTSANTTTKQHSGVFSPVGMRQSKLEAQFLAAYGLATVRAPYSLSAPTHDKILNAERWLEFSEPDAQPDEFSRGYGCAFYPGRTPVNNTAATTANATTTPVSRQRFQRRPSTDDCDADTEQDARAAVPRLRRKMSTSSANSSTTNNSGIVFVAYRRKEVVDERARRQEKDDLEALYRDVEALVGKILDVHMQQQRQAHLETQRALPDVQDVLAAGGFPGVGAACTLRQSRFLGVKAA